MMKTRKILTLTIVHEHPRVLLGMKKRGFGAGKWNGFGGKVEEGETIEEGARRELFEEAGIEAVALEKIGINEFEWKNGDKILEVHVFKAREYSGEPRESDEMATPRWFDADKIPFAEMWSDDIYWFPFFVKNKKFRGWYLFDGNDKVIDYSINESMGF